MPFRRLSLSVCLGVLAAACQASPPSESAHSAAGQDTNQACVILLHGLARSDRSMQPIADALSAAGYRVVNQDYDSRGAQINQLANQALPAALKRCGSAGRVHVVTHSMGGILLRQYLSTHHIDQLGRVVMLGPPNHGSEAVDRLKNVPGFNLINGVAGSQLGTDPDSVPNTLGAWPADKAQLGIIAGTSTISWLSFVLPGADDGKVTLKSTKLRGMQDHIALPVTHTFMMGSDEVHQQVLSFLRSGKFSR